METVTTDGAGRVHVDLDAGDYYAVEIEAAQGFKLDNTPHYFTVTDGKTTTVTITNKPFSGILIHKTDSVTGKGIYGVTFLPYDANNTPIGQYTSDNSGYVYIEGLTTSGRYYLRELENEGYVPDTQMKTVYVTAGQTTLIEWKNIPTTELMVSVSGALAQQESISISQNQRISYKRRMERGEFITCKAPYGYRIKDGKNLVIHEKEAAIIRLIFASYLSGESTVEIAANLTEMGLRTRDGNENWTPLSVSYILQNEKYIGDALCQKTLATDSFPFIKKRNQGEKDQ